MIAPWENLSVPQPYKHDVKNKNTPESWSQDSDRRKTDELLDERVTTDGGDFGVSFKRE